MIKLKERKIKRKQKTCLAGSRKSSMLLYYVWATSTVVTKHRQRSLCAGRADPIRPSAVQFTTRDVPCITRTAPPYVIVLRSRSIINIILYTRAYVIFVTKKIKIKVRSVSAKITMRLNATRSGPSRPVWLDVVVTKIIIIFFNWVSFFS